jgi:acetyltransferase-like isoleucine patch superfamily enzyme
MIHTFFRKILMKLDDLMCSLYLNIYLKKQRGISVGNISLNGLPIVDIRKGARLVIGENVRLNSRNMGYHLNIYAPVKLMADRIGSIIEIGANTRIHGSCIHAFSKINIGKNCLIAANCQIVDCNGHDLSFENVDGRKDTQGTAKPIFIEDSVWLGEGSIVLPDVRIGYGSVIGARSVVTKNIPRMVLAVGNPAKVVKEYSDEESERKV